MSHLPDNSAVSITALSAEPEGSAREAVERHSREFVSAYQDMVVNTCHHFLRDIDDAHDAAQEVFLAALRLSPPLPTDADWRAWLYRAAVNRSLNTIRGKRRRKWLQSIFASARHDEEPANVPVGSLQRPDRAVENDELAQSLDRAISQLPERQRVAFTLYRYEDLSSNEIGAIMNLKSNAVDALLHRARQQLRRKLLQQYREFMDK